MGNRSMATDPIDTAAPMGTLSRHGDPNSFQCHQGGTRGPRGQPQSGPVAHAGIMGRESPLVATWQDRKVTIRFRCRDAPAVYLTRPRFKAHWDRAQAAVKGRPRLRHRIDPGPLPWYTGIQRSLAVLSVSVTKCMKIWGEEVGP